MILDKFLNLQGTCIQGYRHLENIGIVFQIESKNKKAACPRCGLESDKLHQNHRHLVSRRVRSLIWLLLLHRSILGNAPCTLMETVG